MDAVHNCPQDGAPVHTFQPHTAATLWNHMVFPMIGLKFSAVVWVMAHGTWVLPKSFRATAQPQQVQQHSRCFSGDAVPLLLLRHASVAASLWRPTPWFFCSGLVHWYMATVHNKVFERRATWPSSFILGCVQYRIVVKHGRGTQVPTAWPTGATFSPHLAASLWNHMVFPMIGLKFSAVVWVHGARNVGSPTPYMGSKYYGCMLKSMVRDWRQKFQQEDLAFIVAEMPVYCNEFGFKTWHTWCTQSKSDLTEPDEHLPEMRLVQIAAEELPNVRTVSTMDQGSLQHSLGGTIHSIRKSDLGKRIASEFGFKTWHTWCTQSKSHLTEPDEHLAEMRLVQIAAEELPNVRTVSTMDQGSLQHSLGGTIHSVRKSELGERVALAIRAQVYKDTCSVWSGPAALKAWSSASGSLSVCFDTRGGGDLVLNLERQCPPEVLPVYCTGAVFEVRINGTWRKAVPSMGSAKRIVSLEVPTEAAAERVRYAWADWPVNGLTSSAGMPTRTFDLPVLDAAGDDASCPEGPKIGLDFEECRFRTTCYAWADWPVNGLTSSAGMPTRTFDLPVLDAAGDDASCPEGPKIGLDFEECRFRTTSKAVATTTTELPMLAPMVPVGPQTIEEKTGKQNETENANVNFTFIVAAMEESVKGAEHTLEDGVNRTPLRKALHSKRLPPHALLLGLITSCVLVLAAAVACCCGKQAWRKCAPPCDTESGSSRKVPKLADRMSWALRENTRDSKSSSKASPSSKVAMTPGSAEDAPLMPYRLELEQRP
eukprot:CAMPEP_0172932698 /NCGR_PEP_ID=MMETSP1075-20121228/220126_1 /TAXON_ID=2916 /ORGANISM="Ceratium fusus, Strain PA161109" /LENGTH=767 /DNA_ID=CAMNT_0013794029 /DNA_START=237 /DNA_END=2538 /DNA_ORIENTATION=+